MSTANQLQSILDNLKAALPEVREVLIATTDGMPVVHNGGSTDANRIAAMAATALGLGKRLTDTIGGGSFSESSVSGEGAQIFIYAAGSKAVLAVVSTGAISVGLIHLEARSAAKNIAAVLG